VAWAAQAAVTSAGAHVQVCDQRLRPEPSSGFGYALREADVRCEGLYESSVRAPGLEVVSFLYERPRFELEDQHSMKVIAPDVPDFLAEAVKVRAVALPLKTYYRMDAVMPERGALVWPVDEVLGPARFSAEQIGVFGWVGDEADKLLVPLWVLAADDVRAVDAERGTSPDLLVRLANDAETVLWRYREGQKTSEWLSGAPGAVAAGRTVRLSLPPGPPARLGVDVVAKRPDSDEWSTLRLDVIRPGP
jgi:hypothetical protein